MALCRWPRREPGFQAGVRDRVGLAALASGVLGCGGFGPLGGFCGRPPGRGTLAGTHTRQCLYGSRNLSSSEQPSCLGFLPLQSTPRRAGAGPAPLWGCGSEFFSTFAPGLLNVFWNAHNKMHRIMTQTSYTAIQF